MDETHLKPVNFNVISQRQGLAIKAMTWNDL